MSQPVREAFQAQFARCRQKSSDDLVFTTATQLAEVGESLRTAQALLGHSDLETTLNVYTHAVPEAQRRAVEKIAEVLFTDVHKITAATEIGKVN